MMGPKKRSVVWRFFDKEGRDQVVCRLCAKSFKFHTNTSNMKGHLKSKHPDANTEDDDNYTPTTSTSAFQMIQHHSMGEEGQEVTAFAYQKLVVPISMRSVYWKCFGFPGGADGEILSKEKIVCLLCKQVISYNKNTSNLRMHLNNKHPEELSELELSVPAKPASSLSPQTQKPPKKKLHRSVKKEGNLYSTDIGGTLIMNSTNSSTQLNVSTSDSFQGTTLNSCDGENTGKVKVVSKSGTSSSAGKQVTLLVQGADGANCTIESLHPFLMPVQNQTVSDIVVEFIVTDMQSPDIVEGQGFQRLIANLRSPCEIPSKNKLVEEVIPRMYETTKEMTQAILSSLTNEVSLTVEEWDTSNGETYVTFSVCYHQGKGDTLHHRVLSTVNCPPTVGLQYWYMIFSNVLDEWGINVDKIKAVVCGSCREDIVEAIVQRGLTVIPCLVQTLQEVCNRVCFEQEDVRDVIHKCRAYLSLVYKHNNALAALRIQDHLMSLEEMPVTSDHPRVWMSTFTMLESFLVRRQVLASVLDNLEDASYDKDLVTFSEEDWALIEDVLAVLEPFKMTMMTLSEEKSPLLSLLKPLLWQLISCHLQEKPDDSVNAQLFKATMKTLLSEKYSEPIVKKLLQMATAIDPRFKSLPNMAEEAKEVLESPVKDELKVLLQNNPFEDKPVAVEPVEKKPKLSGIMMLMGEIVGPTSSSMSHEDRANLEIVQYQSEATAPLDQCPLAWWSRTEPKCPNLSKLAGQYLCVPATALPPSRLSTDQQLSFDMRRNQLTPETVDRMLFLKSNYQT